jgi:HAD superfamily hydrolase (TIGR01509 family)
MTEEGIPTSRDEFFLYEGRTGASTINLLFRRHHGREATADEIERLYHRKTVYFTQLPPVKPMPGALSVMGQIAAKGLRRVLVTGSGQSSLIDRLDHDFPGIFAPTDRITSRDVSHGKPHPEPYIKAMALAGALPTESIVLENAPLGVESGHASGAFTIAVTTGPIPAADMRQAGADIVFESMELLATTLPQLFETFNKTHI